MVNASVLALDVSKLSRDWHWVLETLREVLERSGDPELANALPSPGKPVELTDTIADSVQLTQAYSIAFQLLGMAEQISASSFRKQIESEQGCERLPALWGESLNKLIDQGLTAEQIASELPEIQVELVLTAHPTEAKRATVLAHHRRLFNRFTERDRTDFAPWQKTDNEEAVRALLTVLWRTGEIYLDKPDVQSERRNVLDYLTHVFPAVLRPLDLRLRQAWQDVGLDPKAIEGPLALPRLTFGTWVGGDRDGHPLITPQVTSETLLELRRKALLLLRTQLTELAKLISLSAYWLPPDESFLEVIAERSDRFGTIGRQAVERNPNEPWRQFVNLMIAQLPSDNVGSNADQGRNGLSENLRYQRSNDLLADLQILYDSFVKVSLRQTADFTVRPLMRIVQTFGFHLAVLDIRQNSRTHDQAIEQLLDVANVEDTNYATWSEEHRLEFLERELQSRRPFMLADHSAGEHADKVLGALRAVRQHYESYGPDGLGALIVSMTHRSSDLIGVYLLAREVGLLIDTPDGPVCPIPVVPLFETIDDLERSPEIFDAFLAHPITKRSLAHIQKQQGRKIPSSQVMIGYSDSNKDGGIMASLIGLRHAQSKLSDVGRKHGIRVRFFHGRGGTISRGAGPTHRFIRSLPDDTLQGDLRLTEQGETIAQKYAHQPTAIYNLELFLSGTTRKTIIDLHTEDELHPLEATLVQLSRKAQSVYRTLLETEGFLDFFRQATPIDAIEQSSIGSRPTRRTGQQTLDDLRAIPWVFSWGQARFYLSGWYGVGSALSELEQQEPDRFAEIMSQKSSWAPLHYLLSNVATSVAAVDCDVIRSYAELVENEEIRTEFTSRIEAELVLSRELIEKVYGGPLAEQRPNVQRMFSLRTEGLRLLHKQQIRLLRRWRSYHRMGETSQADALLPQLLLTVNAIASGLGSTG